MIRRPPRSTLFPLHDALPISVATLAATATLIGAYTLTSSSDSAWRAGSPCSPCAASSRSEEHTSELQSRQYLVCRLLLEKKKKTNKDLLELDVYMYTNIQSTS